MNYFLTFCLTICSSHSFLSIIGAKSLNNGNIITKSVLQLRHNALAAINPWQAMPLLSSQHGRHTRQQLQGIVKDQHGAVIWHASMRMVPAQNRESSHKEIVTSTDQYGQFSAELQPGEYRICATASGFTETCQAIRVSEDHDTKVEFSLSVDKNQLPAEIKVMEQRLHRLSGDDAIDCGAVPVGGNPADATACVIKALRQHRPFYVRYAVQGIDAELSDGIASDGKGEMYGVIFDSLGVTSSNLPSNVTMPDGDHTIVLPCPKPSRIRKAGNGKATCFRKHQEFFWDIP